MAKNMDVTKILAELRQRREYVEEAISTLERLAAGRHRGRGRPPKWMSQVTVKRRGRPPQNKSQGTSAAG
jgi:hypothetical protein